MSQATSTTPISTLSRKTPPGPRGHWLLGSARDFQRDLLGTMLAVHRQYGDVARYRFALWHSYLVNHPAAPPWAADDAASARLIVATGHARCCLWRIKKIGL